MTFDRLWHDVRYALRGLARSPGFTLTAVAAMALGVGATSAIFTVVNAVLIRPLPFPKADQLVMVRETVPGGRRAPSVQTQNYLDWTVRNRSFAHLTAILRLPTNLAGEGDPEQVAGAAVTPSFFQVFAAPPMLGRTFTDEEGRVGTPNVAVLSYSLWMRKYGGNTGILGTKIDLNGSQTEVVGVMGPSFSLPGFASQVFFSYKIDAESAARDGRNLLVAGLLRDGVSLQNARDDMARIAAQTAAERPGMNAKWGATVIPIVEDAVGGTRQTLLVLLGAVASVLLVACVNVANLLLVRGAGRAREVALRTALGAGRGRLAQQFLVESALLAGTGGIAGFALAHWGVRAILGMLPAPFALPRSGEIRVDTSVLLFSLALSVGCGLLFGLAPALQAGRADVTHGLAQGGRSGIGGGSRLRAGLVVAEVALAMLLACGAGLMLRSFANLNAESGGFRTDHVLTMRALLLISKYGPNIPERAAYVERALEAVRALPQVVSASTIHFLPLAGLESGSGYYRADRPAPPPGSLAGGAVSVVSSDYFRTMSIPLLAGRDFGPADRADGTTVAIINDVYARQQYAGEDPIGKKLRVMWNRPEAEIIGVVSSVRHNSLRDVPIPTLFLYNAQQPNMRVAFVVRTAGDPASAIPAVRERIRRVDPAQGIADVMTMEELRDNSLANSRLQTVLIGLFAGLALVLASLGVYGVVAYTVSQRTREIGVRLALGANRGAILRGVLAGGMKLGAAGLAAGLGLAVLLSRQLETMLYGVPPFDAWLYAAVCLVLLAVVAAACLVPARRAAVTDPAVALRDE